MKIKLLALASVAVFGLAAPAQAGVIINVNGRTNAGQLPSGSPLATPVSVALAQGRYLLTFVAPPTPGANFTAVNVWNNNNGSNCNSAGANCERGWFNRIEYFLGSDSSMALTLGESDRLHRYRTAALSFANSGGYSAEVIVGPGGQNFSAFLRDKPVTDNFGGISLSLASVPEPATWAMMIMGFGLIGGAYRSRRTQGKISFA
jgi:hypothetical protein